MPVSSPSAAKLPRRIVIATRESALALWQAHHIESRLLALHAGLTVEIRGMSTEGDRALDATLSKLGGKGLFVKELEEALARGEADIAVHSVKDVPMELMPGHVIGAIPERADPRDAFVSNRYSSLAGVPAGACVGTSSLRRESQLRALRPDLITKPLRGNVPTRLRKLDEGGYDAIILAAAGLKRLGLSGRITALLTLEESLPAAGQGALGIECRAERDDVLLLIAPLDHKPTALAVRAERATARALGASCNVPLGAYAEVTGEAMYLRGYVGSPDGQRVARAAIEGRAVEAEKLGSGLAARLRDGGAAEILAALSLPSAAR
jgi:hydroxymethylbilane synthase